MPPVFLTAFLQAGFRGALNTAFIHPFAVHVKDLIQQQLSQIILPSRVYPGKKLLGGWNERTILSSRNISSPTIKCITYYSFGPPVYIHLRIQSPQSEEVAKRPSRLGSYSALKAPSEGSLYPLLVGFRSPCAEVLQLIQTIILHRTI